MPTECLDGWERTETSVERLFGVKNADVRGHTVVYEDRDRRTVVREATDGSIDRTWRFVFATRLGFQPSLPPATEPLVVPMVRRQATQAFRDDLRDRGVADVETGRRERVRADNGDRRRIQQVTGSVSTPAGPVPVEGWIGVSSGEAIHVAGGAYPQRQLRDALGVKIRGDADTGQGSQRDRTVLRRDPAVDREFLLGFVAAVG